MPTPSSPTPPPGWSHSSPKAVAKTYAAISRADPSPKLSAQASVGLPLAANACTPSRSSHRSPRPDTADLGDQPDNVPVLRRLVQGAQSGTQQPATAGPQSGNRVVRLRRNERLSQVEFEKQVWPSAGKVNHAVNRRPSSADDPNRACHNRAAA